MELTAGERVTIALKWDDWQGRTEDLDLYLYDAGGAVVGRSQTEQNGAAPPTERIDYTPATNGLHQIVIQRFKGTRAVELDLYTEPQRLGNYWVPRRSLTIPADSPRALAVGATTWANDQLEEFSSQGPTFDGRLKPDLTAPDGVMNVTTGAFTGTSAAAPHVAGAAALLKAANPDLGPERLRSVLEAWAADRGAPGSDNAYGAGRLRLAGPTAALPNDLVALDSVFTIDATAGAGGSRKARFQAGETLGYRVDFRTLAPNVTVSIQFDAYDEASAETGERDITLSCRPRSQTLADPSAYVGACDLVVDPNQLPGDYTVRATITVADPAGARTYVQTALFTILPAPPGPTPTPKPVPQHRVLLPAVFGRNVSRPLAAPTVGQSLDRTQFQIYRR
ncbi:MAG: S8 family serine peptidase [Chloroflexi bacterium]|nr:S8 family serine peptidase [Chloroflexota bacterium]